MTPTDIEGGFYQRLQAVTAVTDLVGDRVYQGLAPQQAPYPRVVIADRISTVRSWEMKGPTGLQQARIQIDIYATSKPAVKAVAYAIREALDGYTGPLGDEFAQLVQLIDHSEDIESPDDGGERATYRVRFDFRAHVNESRPNRQP